MKYLRRQVQQWFGFSLREANGFLLLSLGMGVILSSFFWLPAFLPSSSYDSTADKKQLERLVAMLDSAAAVDSVAALIAHADTLSHLVKNRFAFDPNRISSYQWQQLGVPVFLAERILKYRAKGGVFRTKEDLQKIYGFPASLYSQLYPYIQLPDKQVFTARYKDQHPPVSAFPKKSQPLSFDLNTVDTTQLKRVYGVGSALSKRIIKYREALGGFVSSRQVREVYGLDSVAAEEVLKHSHLAATTIVRKIAINRANVDELKAHPYISATLAKVIVAYRQQHGRYSSVSALSGIRILDQSTLQKITPYLSFE